MTEEEEDRVLDFLDERLGIMRRHGVQRIELRDGEIQGIEFFPQSGATPQKPDTSPDYPRPSRAQQVDPEGAGACACGHSMLEHTEDGCMAGCDLSECGKRP